MQAGPGRYELTLNVQEMTVLFFVMIALFTGLLLFGYRVGHTQRANSILIEAGPGPSASQPAEEPASPVPAPAEPNIRMENAPGPQENPMLPAETPSPAGEPLARIGGPSTV